MQQAPDTGLTFVNDYRPGVPFQVVSRIQQTTVNRILGGEQDGQPVSDPTDYDGFIYNYQGCGAGDYNLVFVREATLQQDQTYSFTDATFFSETIPLLEAGIQTGGGAAAGNQTGDTNVTDTNVTDTNVTDENQTEGNQTEGNLTDGNQTEGNLTEGNLTDGNQTGDLNVTINATGNQTDGG